MAYCTFADIQQDIKAIVFTSNSMVTDAAVTKFIAEADALINSYVSQRYVTPITADADALALMSLYSRTLVADRVRGILANKQQTNTDANQQVKSDGFSVKDVMKGLTAIAGASSNLSGATLLLEGGAFYSNNYVRDEQPHFRKDRKQW